MRRKSILDETTSRRFVAARRIFDIEDADEQERAARKLIESDPDCPFAAYLAWQLRDDDDIDSSTEPLARAVAALREPMESALDRAKGDEGDDFIDVAQLYAQMLSDLAAVLYFAQRYDEAYEAASDFMRWNMDDLGMPSPGDMVYYSVLIKRHAYDEVIESFALDDEPSMFAHHARAIAELENNGPSEEATNALLAAIIAYPDLPFFVMGYWELPEEPDGSFIDADELDLMTMMVGILTDLWDEGEGRMAFLAAIAFSFGYLTGRIDDPELTSELETGYKNIGCLDEMRATRDRIAATDADSADEAAIVEFSKLRDRGLFSTRQ